MGTTVAARMARKLRVEMRSVRILADRSNAENEDKNMVSGSSQAIRPPVVVAGFFVCGFTCVF